jgi:anti-sigma-K factor RskA
MVRHHESHEGDPAAYLLGALSDIERQAFERHLMGCATCRDELECLRPAADALPRSVAPVRPPEELKRSVMAVVEAEAEAGEAGSAAEHPRRRGLGERIRALAPAATLRPRLAWTSAALLLTVGVAFGALGGPLLSGRGERTIAAQADPVRLPEASGSFTVANDQGKGGILRVHGMPSLPSRQVYQVWIKRRGEVVSQSIFSVGENGDGAAAVTDDLEGADSVLVTREPAGGARAPSGKPVVSVDL